MRKNLKLSKKFIEHGVQYSKNNLRGDVNMEFTCAKKRR